jgi:hypothetical protein
MACSRCNSSGYIFTTVGCATCGGTGRQAGMGCAYCTGTGTKNDYIRCDNCGGTGSAGSSDYAGNRPSSEDAEFKGVALIMLGLLLGTFAIAWVITGQQGLNNKDRETAVGLTMVGVVIAMAIPFIVNFFRRGVARTAREILFWSVVCAGILFALSIALDYAGLLSSPHAWVRDMLAPVRAYASPARLVELFLPKLMAGASWLMMFSAIVTLASLVPAAYENRPNARMLAAAAIVIGCFLFL